MNAVASPVAAAEPLASVSPADRTCSARSPAGRSVHADRVVQTRYEELCVEPLATLRTAIEFAGPEWRRAIERVPLRSQNDKLQQGPRPRSASSLAACIRPSLARWGYAE